MLQKIRSKSLFHQQIFFPVSWCITSSQQTLPNTPSVLWNDSNVFINRDWQIDIVHLPSNVVQYIYQVLALDLMWIVNFLMKFGNILCSCMMNSFDGFGPELPRSSLITNSPFIANLITFKHVSTIHSEVKFIDKMSCISINKNILK